MEKYITPDMYLAAYLKLKGHKMKVEKNKNKAYFIFDKNDFLSTCISDYLNDGGDCTPLSYTNSIKNLKNLIYNL
jgi:hypothetical protein